MSAVLERAAERIEAFQARNVDAVRLARVASLAVRLDAPLLRTLRFKLVPDADVGAEADLWFSSLIDSCGTSSAVLDEHVAVILRESLLEDRVLLERAATLTREVHASLPPLLRLEEQVTVAALLRGEAGVAEIDAAFRPLMRSLAGNAERDREVARWILRAAPRFPPILWRAPNAYAVLARSSLLLDGRRVFPELPRNDVRLEDIAWALPLVESQDSIDVDVALTLDSLRFTPAHGRSTIQIPAAAPPLVEVVWTDADGTLVRVLAEATPGQMVPLGGMVERLSIRTVAGDVYSIERASAAGQSSAEPRQGWRPERARVLDLERADEACVVVEGASGVRATGFYIGPQTVATASSPFRDERELTVSVIGAGGRARIRAKSFDDDVLILEVDVPGGYADAPRLVDRALARLRTVRIVGAVGERLVPIEARAGRGRDRVDLEVAEPRLPSEFLGAPVIGDGMIVGIVIGLSGFQNTTRLQVAPSRRLRREPEPRVEQSASIPSDTPANAPGAKRRIHAVYAAKDGDLIRPVLRLLQSADMGWTDDSTIERGGRWNAAIEKQIASADLVLVFITRASLASEFVNKEIDLALRYGKSVAPVLLDRDVPLPPNLANFQAIDVSDIRSSNVSAALIQRIRRFLGLGSPAEEGTSADQREPRFRDPADERPHDTAAGTAPWTAIANGVRTLWSRLTGARPEKPPDPPGDSQRSVRRPRGRDDMPS